MTRKAIIHVALLGAFLVAALLTWTREPDTTSDDVPLLAVRGGLDRVVYTEPDRKVTIERRKDDQGDYHWITVEKWEPPPPPLAPPRPAEPKAPDAAKKADEKKPDAAKKADEKKPDEAKKADEKKPDEARKAEEKKAAEVKKVEEKKPEPRKVRKEIAFLGSQSAEELMKSLGKLSALRALGVPGKEKLEGFGLNKEERSLTLEATGTKKALTLGENTYGNMDRYVLDRTDRNVYVVAPRYLGDFPYAEFRLKDSGLSRVQRAEMEQVVVAADGKQKTLLQRHNSTPQKAFFADPSAPDKPKVMYANWVDKVSRLSVVEYMDASDEPRGLKEVLVVAYRGKDKTLDELRLYKAPEAAAPVLDQQKAAPPIPDAYARSRHSRALVKINGTLLDEIMRDLKSVME